MRLAPGFIMAAVQRGPAALCMRILNTRLRGR